MRAFSASSLDVNTVFIFLSDIVNIFRKIFSCLQVFDQYLIILIATNISRGSLTSFAAIFVISTIIPVIIVIISVVKQSSDTYIELLTPSLG